MRPAAFPFFFAIALLLCARAAPADQKFYEALCYALHTDLDGQDAREAQLRIGHLMDEYRSVTGLAFPTHGRKLPFYLFRHEADYLAAGGTPSSGGIFTGKELLVLAGEHADMRTWQLVQHEGFHQFAQATAGKRLPVWLDEGLAEYCGEALFTGDGYVSGIIPPWRLARLKKRLTAHDLPSLAQLMRLSRPQWNSHVAQASYDQVWSLVHFLKHGQEGRYRKVFGAFIASVAQGRAWEEAWQESLGEIAITEREWREYWLGLPDDPTAKLYAQVTATTFAGFLGRAMKQQQRFESFEQFKRAAAEGKLKMAAEDWLPPSLLEQSLKLAERGGSWSLGTVDEQPQIRVRLADQTTITASFVLHDGRVVSVSVETTAPATGKSR